MNFKRGWSLISKSISSDVQYTWRKLSVHSKSVTFGCICEVAQTSHFTVPVHNCCLHAGMTETVWRKNVSVKWGSKFEGQYAGAIFTWVLKIFYMQLIHCLKWTVPGWKSGFIALWKCDVLLNLTYLLVHLYKYSVAFIRPLNHYIFCNLHSWSVGISLFSLGFCAVWSLLNVSYTSVIWLFFMYNFSGNSIHLLRL